MRKFLLFFSTCCLLLSSFTSPKNNEPEDDLSKVQRLYLTCKVWGFLKYYHPKVGTGVYDWDDKLIKVLENTQNITTYDQLNTYMSRWIYAFGPRKPCSSCNQPSDKELFLQNFDLNWTQSSKFSRELRATFKDIEKNRFQGDHYYIGKGKVGQFEPKNESSYFDLNWKNQNERLLPLFRYWNYIEYFFPYKYQTDQDWDEVLMEMIPKFLDANSKLDFHRAMLELVVKVDDGHAGLQSTTLNQTQNFLPVRIDLIEDKAVVTKIIDAEKAKSEDLRVGDVIIAVNGQSVKELHDSHLKYIWGSNESAKARQIYFTLFTGFDKLAEVTIERGGSTSSKILTLYHYSEISYEKSKPKEKWKLLSDSIGYVDMAHLVKEEVDGMMADLWDTQVLIFDVRNYPKGTYRSIANYLNPNRNTFAIFTIPDFSYPGKFIWEGESTCGKENSDYYQGKVILLINEQTQSHAEFTCMCLQTAPNVVIIGSQTAGADGNVTRFPLIQNLGTAFSGIGVFYPDRGETQRKGIIPDIEIKRTITGIRADEDEVLDRAVQIAEEELERLKELAQLKELAKLDSIRRDSLRRAELVVDSLQMENRLIDSLDLGNGDY